MYRAAPSSTPWPHRYQKTPAGEKTFHGNHEIEIRQNKSGPLRGRYRIYVDGRLLQDFLCATADSARDRIEKQVIPRLPAPAQKRGTKTGTTRRPKHKAGCRHRANWY